MTLLELYDKLCTGEIKLKRESICSIKCGLCAVIEDYFETDVYVDFCDLFELSRIWLSRRGIMTPERETFLLLFAAYKGEL